MFHRLPSRNWALGRFPNFETDDFIGFNIRNRTTSFYPWFLNAFFETDLQSVSNFSF